MRIAVLSDLHLTVADMPVPNLDCDVVVLAGDIARPRQAIEWAKQFALPVIYIAGNHEYYGGSLRGTADWLQELALGTNVQVLERTEWRIGGVRFLGCTLWTDFRLLPTEQERNASMAAASLLIRDFSRITLDERSAELFTPALSRALFEQSLAWLDSKFAEPFAGRTVVISHHAPACGSIDPKYAGSPLNPGFVSNLEPHLRRWNPALWIHGHVHHSCDYRVQATRIVCNPRGYAAHGVAENPAFDPGLVVQL